MSRTSNQRKAEFYREQNVEAARILAADPDRYLGIMQDRLAIGSIRTTRMARLVGLKAAGVENTPSRGFMTDTWVTGERIYTVAEVAERYRVRPGWVTDHCTGKRRPLLPGMKIGKSWRFTAANLAAFDQHCAALADQIAKRKVRRIA